MLPPLQCRLEVKMGAPGQPPYGERYKSVFAGAELHDRPQCASVLAEVGPPSPRLLALVQRLPPKGP